VSIVVLLLLVLFDAVVAIVTGVVARTRGRRFWVWALIAVPATLAALLVVLLLPRRR
jgi:hypothetical protein